MKWHKILHRERIDLPTIEFVDLAFYKFLWNYSNTMDEIFFTYVTKDSMTHYSTINFYECGKKYYIKRLSIDNIKKLFREGQKLLKLAKNSNNLSEFINQYKIICEKFSIIPWISIEAYQKDFEKTILNLINKRGLNSSAEIIINSILNPWKKTSQIKLKEDLAKDMPPDYLVKKYQYLSSWTTIWYKPITIDWIKSIPYNKKKKKILNKNKIISILKPNKEELLFIKTAPYVTFFKDYRDDIRRKFADIWRPFFINISKKLKLDYNDLGYLTIEEIKSSLKNGVNKSLIKERKNKDFIISIRTGKLKIEIFNKNLNHYMKIINKQKIKTLSYVKGQIAKSGKIIGRVIVLKTDNDLKKVKKGDILIATITHPNFLSAMNKVSAIVTDEGGLISHAAIVARELNIPCIVGTKIATKVFKDNDLVEVDANKGVVRKISK